MNRLSKLGHAQWSGPLSHDALDARAEAYTAVLAGTAPQRITPIGDPEEGEIILPIAPAALKASYTRL